MLFKQLFSDAMLSFWTIGGNNNAIGLFGGVSIGGFDTLDGVCAAMLPVDQMMAVGPVRVARSPVLVVCLRKSRSMPSSPLQHCAFYRFTPIADPWAAAIALRSLAQPHNILGTIVLAQEGISGAIAATPEAIADFESAVQADTFLNAALHGMPFKHSPCASAPFGRLKISVKPEIVALGLPLAASLPPPDEHDNSHLSPQAWRELLARGDAVVLDNRNHFEYRLGHFKAAVDPQVHNFRDFVDYVQQHAPAWRAAGKPVAMYCTGGIRCEKAAPWMRSLGLNVLQLEGGILNFFQQLPDATKDAQTDWQGACFVFDNRIALDSTLQEAPTTPEQVFDEQHADEAWRLQRALRLNNPN
jgi:UPF0176 protein